MAAMGSAAIAQHRAVMLGGLAGTVMLLTMWQSSSPGTIDADWVAQECNDRQQALESALAAPSSVRAILEACDAFAATLPSRDSTLLKRGYLECARMLADPSLDPAEQDMHVKELEKQMQNKTWCELLDFFP